MAVDSAVHIGNFDIALPAAGDSVVEGDDNFRHVKTVLKTDFAAITGAVTATHTELNYCVGVTSAIQTQITARGSHAGQTWTGTHSFTGATITVPTATAGDATTLAASTLFVSTAVASVTNQAWAASTTAVSKTLAVFEFCRVTAAGQTITFPASPSGGISRIGIEFDSGVTGTFDPNGAKIKGSSGTMTANTPGQTYVFMYLDSTVGWVLGA